MSARELLEKLDHALSELLLLEIHGWNKCYYEDDANVFADASLVPDEKEFRRHKHRNLREIQRCRALVNRRQREIKTFIRGCPLGLMIQDEI